ncbi:hypothetical protein LTR95_016920 [Oleoguttula sp. CCFEE 5521]
MFAPSLFASRAGYANAIAGDYLYDPNRRGSTTSSSGTSPPNPADPVALERSVTAPTKGTADALSESDIIIITVRITPKSRRASFDDPLPDRPAPRSFIRRLSTRISTPPDATKYKAVKMPRGEYLRHHRHDHEGKYVGTEPQKDWTEEEVEERYAQYQEMRLTNSFRGTAIGAGVGGQFGVGMVGLRPWS